MTQWIKRLWNIYKYINSFSKTSLEKLQNTLPLRSCIPESALRAFLPSVALRTSNTYCIPFYAVLSVHRSGYADTAVKPRNSLGHRVQNVPENLAKTSLRSLHFKTYHALRCKKKPRLNSSRDDFPTKSFPSSTKENWAFCLTFSLHLCLLTMYF